MAEIPDANGQFQAGPAPVVPLELDEDYPRLPPGHLAKDNWQHRLLLGVVGTAVNFTLLLGIAFVLAQVQVTFGFLLLLFQIVVYGWLLFAYVSYRQGRQEELVQVLTTAVETEAPLPGALRAYVDDRPHGGIREFIVAAGLCLLLPGYYWIWYRWYSYDQLVYQLAGLLEQGELLHHALQDVPGLVPRETVMAAAVGENTGKLALCLRYASRRRLAEVWGEVLPRLLYPVGLFIYISGVISFWTIYIMPKMQKIFVDMKKFYPDATMPRFTDSFINVWPWLSLGFWLVALLGMVLFVLQLSGSWVCWYLPVLGWFYRRHVQSQFLQMLGILLDAGRPAPEALSLLAQSGYFRGFALTRVAQACRDVSGGEPLASGLVRAGLLPPTMAALVDSAQRVHNLPRTLGQLGEHLANRVIRWLRWISLVFAPLSVLALGWLVFSVGLSLFLPLLQLMKALTE